MATGPTKLRSRVYVDKKWYRNSMGTDEHRNRIFVEGNFDGSLERRVVPGKGTNRNGPLVASDDATPAGQ